MAQVLTTSKFLKSVKRRASIPESQVTFTEDDFLDIANEEMDNSLVASVMTLHEEYFTYSQDVDILANKAKYDIPYRAVGNKLRDLFFKDFNGNYFEMTRISPENRHTQAPQSGYDEIRRFYLQGSQIVLLPKPTSATGYLTMSYFLRPNKLVKENRTGKVVSVNTTTGEVTIDIAPSVFSANIEYDIVQGKSPNTIRKFDIEASAYNNTTKVITFAAADVDGLEVGDYICLAGETPIPNIPTELHSMLAQRVACRCLESLGHTEGLQLANAKLAEMEKSLGIIIDNRVEGAPQKIVNTQSILLNRNFRRGW